MERIINISYNGKSYTIQQDFIDCFTWQSDKANGERIEKVLPLPKNLATQIARFVRINPVHDDKPAYIKEEETEDFSLELYDPEEYLISVSRHQLNPNTGYFFMGDAFAFFAKENNYRMSFSPCTF